MNDWYHWLSAISSFAVPIAGGAAVHVGAGMLPDLWGFPIIIAGVLALVHFLLPAVWDEDQ